MTTLSTPITPMQKAESLRKEGNFQAALEMYAAHWKVSSLFATEWDFWGYAHCLLKMKHYAEALDFCRKAYPRFPQFAALNNCYAWAVYYEVLQKVGKVTEEEFLRAAKGIIRLCKADDTYSPYVLTVFKVLERFTVKNTFHTEKVLEWCALLNPTTLDDSSFVFTDVKGKQMEMASKRERFFAWQTKALLLSGKYKDCIVSVHQAFGLVEKFHYGNEFWLRRTEALAVAALDNYDAAITLLLSIWAERKEWFLAWDMAKIASTKADMNQAWSYCVKAVVMPGDAPLRVGLYKLMGDILMQKGNMKAALQHYELAALIREENNWTKDISIATILEGNGVKIGEIGSSLAVLDELKAFWEKENSSQYTRYQGCISSLLRHGKAGFIKADNGKSYYFQLRDVKSNDKSQFVLNTTVSYVLVEGFDRVKNKITWNATEIYLVQS